MNKTYSLFVIQILAFLAHFLIGSVSTLRRQELVLYSESNFTGLNVTYYDNEPDIQSNSEIGRIAKSFCIRSGMWVVAGLINGVTTFDGWNTANIGEFCTTWNIRNQTAIFLSIRRVSGNDLDRPSLSLYSERNFRGTEVHVDSNQSDLRLQNLTFVASSVAFTGRRHWDMFPASNFAGQPHCLQAKDLFGHPMDISFYDRQTLGIGSLKLDCTRLSRQSEEDFPSKNTFTSQLVQTISRDDGDEMSFQLSTTVGSHMVGNTRVTGKGSSQVLPPTLSHLYRTEPIVVA